MKILIIIVSVILVLLVRYLLGTEREYQRYVDQSLKSNISEKRIITKEDLEGLPEVLVRYLNYVGIVGTEHVNHFKVIFKGEMRLDQDKEWAPIKAEQYSFIKSGQRLFSISMKFKGLSINGIHHFNKNDAYMTIKILDLIKVAHNQGEFMTKGETVTWFNDLCIMAPGALLQEDIEWTEIDKNTVKGVLYHNGVTVSAILTIDDEGKLVNFISEDRYAANNDGKYNQLPWSTPMSNHRKIREQNIAYKGEAVWHYPDNDFSYIKLEIEDIVINP